MNITNFSSNEEFGHIDYCLSENSEVLHFLDPDALDDAEYVPIEVIENKVS